MSASVTAHRDYRIATIDDRLYGAFLEHLGRAIYTGIYEPDHPTADANGMREDVIDLVRDLNVPIVRYPGGNFVSAYNWEDGIGPRDKRPTRLDLAWHTSETNAVGMHEFADWCDTAGTEMMLAINLGSRGLDQARNFVEYVNGPTGSYWGDLRKKNGRADPFGVKHWCLGNEMDGPWQVGHKTADEYGRLANETAKTLRAFDKSLELIVCGSSHSDMTTYPEWERDRARAHLRRGRPHLAAHVFRQPRQEHRRISRAQRQARRLYRHRRLDDRLRPGQQAQQQEGDDLLRRMERLVSFQRQDREILDGDNGWPHAPRLLEDIYNFEDALQVGCILNTFIRRSDVVKIACIAQLVNVIAPIMTEPGGAAWRQTIYYPYFFASVYGRGEALQLTVNSPGYDAEVADNVPYLDIAGVHDEAGRTLTFFAVNRHAQRNLDLELDLQGFGAARLIDHQAMTNADLEAVNTLSAPLAVAPKKGSEAEVKDGRLTARLPPYSYQMMRLALA